MGTGTSKTMPKMTGLEWVNLHLSQEADSAERRLNRLLDMDRGEPEAEEHLKLAEGFLAGCREGLRLVERELKLEKQAAEIADSVSR